MTPKEYVKFMLQSKRKISNLQHGIVRDRPSRNYPLPMNVRKATKEDIIVGAVIWYKSTTYCDSHWRIVQYVLDAESVCKAFYAYNSCKYGLDGAFVEVVE